MPGVSQKGFIAGEGYGSEQVVLQRAVLKRVSAMSEVAADCEPHQSASGEAPGAAGAATTVHPVMAAVADEQGQQSETAGDGNHLSRTLTDGRFSRYKPLNNSV